jgi:hypothetical protein
MFKECTEERWDEMLGVLPPALWIAKGFLVGEPFDHRTCKITGVVRATYAAFINHGGKFYEGPSLTTPEFQAFDVATLKAE